MKTLISLSGGADSATALAILLHKGIHAEAVGFRYGSKHNEFELASAKKIAEYYNIPFDMIDITGCLKSFRSNLLKDQGEIPEGDYREQNMSLTVVPARNLIFATILAGLAESRGISSIALGVHAGDHYIYPDCRPQTITALETAISAGTDGKVHRIFTPLLMIDKIAIIREGLKLKVPYHLTRTCYKAQEKACGKCGSCRERKEAFAANRAVDPIEYED